MLGMTVDSSGGVTAVGRLSSAVATFGNTVLSTISGSSGDAVLWKLSAEGTTLWAVLGGGDAGFTSLKSVVMVERCRLTV